MITEVTTLEQFEQTINSDSLVVVDFAGEDWCHPCRQFRPHFDRASEFLPNVTFLHVDVDTAEPGLIDKYGILGVPTVIAFKGGEIVGYMLSRTLLALVNEIEALD